MFFIAPRVSYWGGPASIAHGPGLGCYTTKDSTDCWRVKHKEGSSLPPRLLFCLQNLNVFSLPSLGAALHFEADCLAFLQRTETVRLDGREMNEHIFAVLT